MEVIPSTLGIYDRSRMDVVEQYAHLRLHPGAGVLLLFGDHGDEATEARSFGVASVPGYPRNCAVLSATRGFPARLREHCTARHRGDPATTLILSDTPLARGARLQD